MTTAFVLGGGGVLGAVEVGMLRALLERDIVPDLVLGTSVNALNSALVAGPDLSVVERLTALWQRAGRSERPGVRRQRPAHRPPGRVDQDPPLVVGPAAAGARRGSSAT